MNERTTRTAQGAPTIADVAQEAGFSMMTVSRVINGESNVRDSTRDAVQAAIAKLNYSPNLAARSLAGAEQIRIGLLYSNPSAAYLSRYLLGSLEQARLSHVQLTIENCASGTEEEEKAVRDLIASGVDGILLPPPLCDSTRILQILVESSIDTVIVANYLPPLDVSVVRIDDQAAAAAMTRHLIALGHRRIGFILGDPSHKASEQRLIGFRAAIAEAGLAIKAPYIVQGAFTYRSGLDAASVLLTMAERPSAIFASNDDMAAATVAVAHRMHIEVPRALTVCGFDDTDFARSIWPELTTIHQPIAEMSRRAVEMLVRKIRDRRAGKDVVQEEALLDFTLIRRESDAPPEQ
jgi:LacI family transcriptional regulator